MTYKPGPSGGASSSVANWVNNPSGFDAQSRRRAPTADKKRPSGYFARADGTQIAVWITKITADFTISGEQGQSQMLREFFPRSFNDVTLKIVGSVANTQEFNRLSLFVRESHWKALQNISSGKTDDPTLSFVLHGTHESGPKFPYSGRNVKGPHRGMSVSGYVRSIDGGAVRHEVAPEFAIDFVVATSSLPANSNTGIWSDVALDVPVLKDILQMIPNQRATKDGKGFVIGKGNTVGNAIVSTLEQNRWSVAAALSALNL